MVNIQYFTGNVHIKIIEIAQEQYLLKWDICTMSDLTIA